jgi:hypothetical protein
LHSEDVVEPRKSVDMCTIFESQYDELVKMRLDRCVSLFQTLTRNKLAPFDENNFQTLSKSKKQVASLKNDCFLFSQLYIGCRTRSGNIDEFFDHENKSAPPSLSDGGKLKFGSKSHLLQCLEKLSSNNRHVPLDDAAVILNGAAIAQMLKPGCVKTFADYANEVFIPFMASQLRIATESRVDLDWDW